ncbi:hypothetical protein F5884DRAFT_857155 [Xylogone sp. PMI_703]|nr:hypothetical protein F5884DRAFT_857155 [Xylogone sp. PMI_703]
MAQASRLDHLISSQPTSVYRRPGSPTIFSQGSLLPSSMTSEGLPVSMSSNTHHASASTEHTAAEAASTMADPTKASVELTDPVASALMLIKTARVRRRYCHRLYRLDDRLTKLTKHQVKPSKHKKLKISVNNNLNLDDGSFDSAYPHFFIPYQGPLPPPDDEEIGTKYPRLDAETKFPDDPTRTKDRIYGLLHYFDIYWTHCTLEMFSVSYENVWSPRSSGGGDIGGLQDRTWRLHTLTEKRDYPHLICTMTVNLDDGDDGMLFRGELLAISRFMAARLRSKECPEDVKAPLAVNYSRLYDFNEKDDATLELFTRWALAQPTGNTKLDPAEVDSMKKEVTKTTDDKNQDTWVV